MKKRKPIKKPQKPEIKGFGTITAQELQRKDFPELQFIVEGMLVEGATLLAGKAKIGKSWLAMQIAMAVATGGKALDSIPCEQGTVLYAALEDNPRRLQRRLRQLYGDSNEWPSNFYLMTLMPELDEDGIDKLDEWIDHYKPRLVIIDTLAKVRPRSLRLKEGYSSDYQTLEPLQELAGEYGIGILIITHQRKQDAEDPFDTISGSTGLTGAVDTALVLSRGSNGTTLYGRGREIDEFEKALKTKNGMWVLLGDADEVHRSDERKAIIELLMKSSPLSPKEIASALGQPENNTRQLLLKMCATGEVEKVARGRYAVLKKPVG